MADTPLQGDSQDDSDDGTILKSLQKGDFDDPDPLPVLNHDDSDSCDPNKVISQDDSDSCAPIKVSLQDNSGYEAPLLDRSQDCSECEPVTSHESQADSFREAVRIGNVEQMQALLSSNGEELQRFSGRDHPVFDAICAKKPESVKFILENIRILPFTLKVDALMEAIKTDEPKLVLAFLSVGYFAGRPKLPSGLPIIIAAYKEKKYEAMKAIGLDSRYLEAKNKIGETVLFDAVTDKNMDVLKILLELGAHPFTANLAQKNILDHASDLLYFDILKLILSYVDDTQSQFIVNSLVNALKKRNFEAVKTILDRPISLEKVGFPTVAFALKLKKDDLAKQFIEKNASIRIEYKKKLPLIYAIEGGFSDLAMELIDIGAKIAYLVDSESPLFIAVKNKMIKVANCLVEHDASVSDETLKLAKENGMDEFIEYVKENNALSLSFINYLLSSQEKIEISEEQSKVFEAASKGLLHYLEEYYDKFKTLDFKNDLYQTPLMVAKNTCISFLLTTNIPLDHQDKYGKTALMYHIQKNYTIRELIEKGPNLNIVDRVGKSALHYLMAGPPKYCEEYIDSFINNGFKAEDSAFSDGILALVIKIKNYELFEKIAGISKDYNIPLKDGRTPLFCAVEIKNRCMVDLLLKNDVKLDIANRQGKTPLHVASEKSQSIAIQLVEKGASAKIKDKFGSTPLHYAAQSNFLDLVKLLIQSEADINANDKENNSPLLLALTKGSSDVAKYILKQPGVNISFDGENPIIPLLAKNSIFSHMKKSIESGGDVNSIDCLGYTALHYAAINGNYAMAEYLINKGADISIIDKHYGRTPLIWSSLKGCLNTSKLLIYRGADLDVKGFDGKTASQCALLTGISVEELSEVGYGQINENESILCRFFSYVSSGDIKKVEYFTNDLIDLNSVDRFGRTALFLAAKNGYASMIQLLLDSGADISRTNLNGMNSVHGACMMHSPDALKLLIKHHANVNVCSSDEHLYPVHIAAENNYLEALKLLVSVGASIDSTDSSKNTPLHIAASLGFEGVSRFLLSLKPNLNAKNIFGETPLIVAVSNHYPSIAIALVEHGADFNIQDNEGRSALHLSIISTNDFIFKYLIFKRANINVVDSDGVTPIYLAYKNGNMKFLKTMISKKQFLDEILDPEGKSIEKDILELFNQYYEKKKKGKTHSIREVVLDKLSQNTPDFKTKGRTKTRK